MANDNPTAGTTSAKKSTPSPAATRPPATVPAGADSAPATTAVADAAREAEVRQLTEQRDTLRQLVGEAPTLEMLRAEVTALQQVAARAGVSRPNRWTMSAGVAADLEQSGYAVDPATGDAYVRDGDRVTVTSRRGDTRTIAMPKPSGGGNREDKADQK
ncbi:hypothetical protein ABGB07_44005 [Micromonosporaceae bacterium B7E4]